MLNTSTLSWAATRSGMSLGEFLSALTPEKEIAIQEAYNAWRASKGLAPVQAAPDIRLPLRPAEPPAPIQEEADDADDGDTDASDAPWLEGAYASYDSDWEGTQSRSLYADAPLELPDEELVAPDAFSEALSEVARRAKSSDASETPAPAPAPAPSDLAALLARLPREAEDDAYRAALTAAGSPEALREAVNTRIEARRKSRKSTGPLKALLSWLDKQP